MRGRQLEVRGLVQGVGFRPYVWHLAKRLGLNGSVCNDGAGVTIVIAGEKLDEFLHLLPLELPPLARIDRLDVHDAVVNDTGFAILDSAGGPVRTAIGPDAASCPACRADLCTPGGRRWRYAFSTCTHCGPRYTVSRKLPYDRAQTSLAEFPLCPACAGEYADPADRRFHAETTCCPVCGPRLRLLDADGLAMAGDPLAESLRLLRAGKIVAIKGLGGFHLACDARQAATVAALRERKQREAKPFAVMGLNVASFAGLARIGETEAALLSSPAGPVVLCAKGEGELPGVAPGLGWLGVMLPMTPLHLLLWHEAAGRPAGSDWQAAVSDLLLVMTSANPHGEPVVIGNEEACTRLHGIADAYLVHDREIVVRCDDSVLRLTSRGPVFLRRARGYVPLPIAMAQDGANLLAVGGHLKATVCVLRGQEAFLSQHVGGLDNVPAIRFLEETIAHLLAILDVRPELIAHDLHPDYASTHLARRLAEELGVPAVGVGHHQAHLAAICLENAVNEPLIGLALDGVGWGPDGTSWGGELLRLDGAQCVRLGHLQTLALPGGDRAAREPWRMAVSGLHLAGMDEAVVEWLARRYPGRQVGPIPRMLAGHLHSPQTSSLGRWFDMAAGLLGLCEVSHYEGQAAMMLESLALAHGPVAPLAGGYRLDKAGACLDFSPLIQPLLDSDDAGYAAALFHATVAAGLAAWLGAAAEREQVARVAVGGGCAQNEVLMSAVRQALSARGLALLEAQRAPANDGGLALGQAWVARQVFKEMKNVSGDSGASR